MKSAQQHRARPRIEEILEPRVISIVPPGDSSTKPAYREAMSESELREALAEQHDSAYGWALHCCGGRRDEAMDILHSAYVKTVDGRAVFSGRSTLSHLAVRSDSQVCPRRRRSLPVCIGICSQRWK